MVGLPDALEIQTLTHHSGLGDPMSVPGPLHTHRATALLETHPSDLSWMTEFHASEVRCGKMSVTVVAWSLLQNLSREKAEVGSEAMHRRHWLPKSMGNV